ncbi:GNAT family N-acetyltransferase [Bacillus sp. CGMCC 1.16607]|uniref:GNAT family N-acetyltransferase n=1 Tax=Bacillus sp. CGMCC 1.16607 TaxID=3351842 RepID=UPI00363A998A
MNYFIRDAKIEDISEIQNVAMITWNYTYEGIIPYEIQEQFLNFAYSIKSMEQRIRNSILLVGELNGKIIGFANFYFINVNKDAELGAIYIYPEWHGKGLGTELLREGLNRLVTPKRIFINVEHKNEIGKNYYVAKGFKKIKEFEEFIGNNSLKMVRMVLEIE